MCGVLGVVSSCQVIPLLVGGLRGLEYRGYDSCGVAVLDQGIQVRRACGKVAELSELVSSEDPLRGNVGIAHTRWATHGAPKVENAHPICAGEVAVVHNGIVENYLTIRKRLEAVGSQFHTDTDTEVIPHMVWSLLQTGLPPRHAVRKALREIEGNFAVVFMFAGYNNLLATCRMMPLVVGYGTDMNLVSSDEYVLHKHAQKIFYLRDNHIAEIALNYVQIYNENDEALDNHDTILVSPPSTSVDRIPYDHFMLKEIHEQPRAIQDTINQFIDVASKSVRFACDEDLFKNATHLTIVGSGSSYMAGFIAKYWMESIANIRVITSIASEFRHYHPRISGDDVFLFISQSGETADTLEALRRAKQQCGVVISLTNVPRNSMERISNIALKTLAGPEVGVASTKTFSTQLAVLACFSLWLAKVRCAFAQQSAYARLSEKLQFVAQHVSEALRVSIEPVIDLILRHNRVIIMGRGTCYGVALEAALKIRELSYIHTIGIASGELKHGSIALVDESLPVIAIAPYNEMFAKSLVSIQEVSARKGIVIAFTDRRGAQKLRHLCEIIVELPETNVFSLPVAYTVASQLLAYRIAIRKGLDADQPRNLAKSVTVE
ncbi:glutamine--fructose-6-phosphate transaminase (isomerizing) [Anaplasma capra]|uniref:glutamine--fructose-6-phosphate transaminase (isomerizing) n=1 Tax=Anaplasma capra TaxID=1562740 RepID=UPI0021D5ACC6|nr:glutamine--fructose-6-phosphate transaminase (isomerizing) [Anaplasma capra]MCU7611799.1 glutamine--fructose-6-phosphate transaminase (isomerizing) [Anaplasma capra]MCU7612642.1 glutamine--fructose-6-phosphate transaminase (isomerizing) [Anaplasma capra]